MLADLQYVLSLPPHDADWKKINIPLTVLADFMKVDPA